MPVPSSISDGTHVVVIAGVEIVCKADDLHVFPIPSFWYLDIQSTSGFRRLTFTVEADRDDFYTRLVTAIG